MELNSHDGYDELHSAVNRTAESNTFLNLFKNFKLNRSIVSDRRKANRKLSKWKRTVIFWLLFLTNIVINFDHGAIPAATTEIKAQLKMSNFQLGSLGSLVFFGITVGSVVAGPCFNNYASKWIVTISFAFEAFFLWLFCQSDSVLEIGMSRFACGFFQVFSYIYFPVWVDQYGLTDHKTMWLTYLQLGVPVGTMLGYVLTAISIAYFKQWQITFYIQGVALVVSCLVLTLVPDMFFSRHYINASVMGVKQELDNHSIFIHGEYTQEDIKTNTYEIIKKLIQKKVVP